MAYPGQPQGPNYPAHGGYSGGPYYPGQGGQPPKSRTGIVVAVIVAAVLLLVGIGVVLALASGNDNDSQGSDNAQVPGGKTQSSASETLAPRPTPGRTGQGSSPAGDKGDEQALRVAAQAYVDAVNNNDIEAAKQAHCDKSEPGALFEAAAGSGRRYIIGESELVGHDYGTVEIKIESTSDNGVRQLFRNINGWCVTYG